MGSFVDEFKKMFIFIKRDISILFTYKLALTTMFFGSFFQLFYLVLFGGMFGQRELDILAQHGGDFISYILVGSIGWGFLWSVMGSTSKSIRSEMKKGTLESILLTDTKLITIMAAYTIFGSLLGLLGITTLILVGYFVLGVTAFQSVSIYTGIIFLLSILLMMGLGMIAAGLTFKYKRIGDFIPIIQNLAMFVSGVYFPLAVLPRFLQPVGRYQPFYYAMQGLRLSILPEVPVGTVQFYVGILAAWVIGSIIVGYYILLYELKKAKEDGSLAHY